MRVRGATILTILAAVATSCARHEQPKAAEPVPIPTREVTTAEVVRSAGNVEVTVPGAVQARKRAALSARMPASVTELPFREGQRVEAGAVVVRLDDSALRAAVAATEAAVRAAESDLARTQALLEKGAATPRELEQMTAAARGAQAQLTGAKDNLSYAALRAPFSGRIAARRVNLGDVANPGMPLIEIEGDGGLEVRATVEAEVAANLAPGVRLEALVDGQPDALTATVSAIAPAGDPTTHRFELKADLPQTAGLRAGLFARLLVPGGRKDPKLMVPVEALFERGGLTGVFVVADGTASLRWIAPGARDGAAVEVRAGLNAGEQVVLNPVDLVDGNPVRPGSAAGTAPAEGR